MAVPTPDSIPGAVICRSLSIPDDPLIIGAVTGALLALTQPWHWEQHDPAAVTPDDIAAAMKDMLDEYLDSEC